MKKITTLFALILMIGLGAKAEILTTNSYWQPVGGGISDQNPNGTNSVITVSGIVGTIENLSVFLNVTNGFNGDLYAYLVDPNGDFAVLLNRTGVDGTDPFGYGDGGFDVTFTLDSTTNIHFYQNFAYSLNGGGQLTGTWAVDGRNIDPMTNGAILASAPSTATLNSFFGTNPNGEWTLFIADMSGEYESIWNGWGLEIVSVPEPGTNLLLALGACGAAFFLRRKSRDVVR